MITLILKHVWNKIGRPPEPACRSMLCLAVIVAAAPVILPAQETAATTRRKSQTDRESVGDQRSVDAQAAERESKRRTVVVAVYLLAGIAFVGLALLALVVLWGHRIRRIARTPLPRQSQTDEFWYLRPNKEIGTSKSPQPRSRDADGEERETS